MRYVALICLGLWSLAAQPYDGCNVSLRVVDYQGRPAPFRVVSFVDEAGHDYADHFEGLRGRVPCSSVRYSVVVSQGIVGTDVHDTIVVKHPEVAKTLVIDPYVVILNGQVGSASFRLPPDYVWRGHLLPAPRGRYRVNIRSVVAPITQEADIDDDGEFRMYDGFIIGRYILTVMDDDGKIIHSTILNIARFAPQEPLVITLGADPTVIDVR